MFTKNINALKINNPKLAEKLENFPLETAANLVSVLQANSGDLLIAYNNNALEDVVNPLDKAKETWESSVKQNLVPNDIVVVFGLGLGYLFKRAYISCSSRIALYEPNMEILRFVLEYVDFSSEISDKRIFVSDSQQEIIAYLTEKYISNDKVEILFSNNYVNLFSSHLLSLSEKIVFLCESKNTDVATIMKYSASWVINSIDNAQYMNQSRPLSFFKDKFAGKVALIIAAGPSLRNDIDLIKENKDKYVIFAVNKIFDYLIENGIEPDFLVASDARLIDNTMKVQPDVFSRINLIATSKTDPFVFKQDFNSKIVYYLANDAVFEELRKRYPVEIEGYETEGTSISQCYYSAIELGFKTIIFSGLDLAIKPETPYATDMKMDITPEGKILVFGETRDLVKIKSVTGEDIFTRKDYSIFAKQLEKIFEGSDSVVKYNTSDFGAYLKGMIYEPLNEIVRGLSIDALDIDLLIEEVYKKTENKWMEVVTTQTSIFINQRDDLLEIKEQILKWIDKNSEKINKLDVDRLMKYENDFIRIRNEELDIVKQILTNDLLALSVQVQLLEFSRINRDESNFLKARKYSLRIFNIFVQRIEVLLAQISNVLS